MQPTTPGLLHIEPPAPTRPEPEAGGPVGIVVAEYDQASVWLAEFPGGLATGYHVIRDVADVPERLGGIAILGSAWPPGLAEALARACGLG